MTIAKVIKGLGTVRIALMASCMALSLAGCQGFDTPTQVNMATLNVEADSFQMEFDTASFDQAAAQAVSRYHWSHGNSPAHVTVSFDPDSSVNTARKAGEQTVRISNLLKSQGLRDVETETLPVKDSGRVSVTSITFQTLQATAPDGCGDPMDMTFADIDKGDEYRLGCSVETYIAKQIARPADLLGNNVMDNSPARPVQNAVESRYMAGEMNPELSGDLASE